MAREQRLAAVQNDAHLRQRVRTRVFGDPFGGHVDQGRGHGHRARAPALIGHHVDVAVVAGQVAAAVDLEKELLEWAGAPAGFHQSIEIKRGWPLLRRVPRVGIHQETPRTRPEDSDI